MNKVSEDIGGIELGLGQVPGNFGNLRSLRGHRMSMVSEGCKSFRGYWRTCCIVDSRGFS